MSKKRYEIRLNARGELVRDIAAVLATAAVFILFVSAYAIVLGA